MILGFKGFKPGLIATLGDGSYQYQPGEVSKTEKAKCANTGFHYCLDPLDCLNWYAWDGKNEFWAIAAGGDIDEDDYRTRSSCTEIVPLRRLKEDEFLLMHANYAFEHPAEKFEDCFKRPFHIAYGQGKELAGARGEWLCFIVRGENESCQRRAGSHRRCRKVQHFRYHVGEENSGGVSAVVREYAK